LNTFKNFTLLAFTLIFTLTTQVYAQPKNSRVSNEALNSTEIESLLFMREEEKMARDVYITLFATWNDAVFDNIAQSEQEHMDALKLLLDKYNLADPAVDSLGVFNDYELQLLYDALLARGEISHREALYVGALIEEVDMRDIQEAIDSMENEDMIRTYESLLKGSRNHFRSFVSKIEAQGAVYEAQVLTQEEVDAIVDSPMERGKSAVKRM